MSQPLAGSPLSLLLVLIPTEPTSGGASGHWRKISLKSPALFSHGDEASETLHGFSRFPQPRDCYVVFWAVNPTPCCTCATESFSRSLAHKRRGTVIPAERKWFSASARRSAHIQLRFTFSKIPDFLRAQQSTKEKSLVPSNFSTRVVIRRQSCHRRRSCYQSTHSWTNPWKSTKTSQKRKPRQRNSHRRSNKSGTRERIREPIAQGCALLHNQVSAFPLHPRRGSGPHTDWDSVI